MRLTALLLLVAACAPEAQDPELHQDISGAVGQVLHPSHVYVRYLEAEGQLVIFERLEGAELARLAVTAGARAPLALDGRPCELESHGASEEVEHLVAGRSDDETVRRATPQVRERRTKVARVTLRCADGPAPGIPAAAAVRALDVVAWLPLALLAGMLAAFLHWRGEEQEQLAVQLGGLALGLAALVTAAVVSWRHLDGALCLTVPLLAGFVGACGATGTLLFLGDSARRSRLGAIGVVLASVPGPLVVALGWPVWAAVAPLAALGLSLVVAIAVLVFTVK